jgi:MYXO-CTERM domain-containing protein
MQQFSDRPSRRRASRLIVGQARRADLIREEIILRSIWSRDALVRRTQRAVSVRYDGGNALNRSAGLLFVLLASFGRTARADVLSVGPNGAYAAPCAAFAAAADGDTVEIDSGGMYDGDVCPIGKNGLTIRGTPGLAKIDADGKSSGGKAIWVVQGDDTTIENVEFSGASVPDMNGAGIRQEGKNLTVRGCVFRDNEDGILGGDGADSHVLIENSEFDHNGAGDGYSHNLYIGHAGKLTFRYNWSHRSVIGHLLKSRAAENYVLYNRITAEADGSSSYELNFPNGGKTYVIGNLVEQSQLTDNTTFLSYIEEGAHDANPSHRLFVVNNTFVNDRGSGTFLNVATGADPLIATNNVFYGGGSVTNQTGAVLSHNYSETESCLVDAASFDYRLKAGTPCVDGGQEPGDGGGFALLPTEHYVHPRSHVGRVSAGSIDIGAFELGGDAAPEGGAGSEPEGGADSGQAGTNPAGGQPGSAGSAAQAGASFGGASVGGSGSSLGGSASSSGGNHASSDSDAGCSCRTTSSSPPSWRAGWLIGIALGAVVRRRRSMAATTAGRALRAWRTRSSG